MAKLKLHGDKIPIFPLKIWHLLHTHIPGSCRDLHEMQGPLLGCKQYLELRRMMKVELEPH